MRNHEGVAVTPTEDFILDLARLHVYCREQGSGLTPDSVEGLIRQYREWFDDAVRIARTFSKQYSRFLAEEKEEVHA